MKHILIMLIMLASTITLNGQTWTQLQTPNTRNLYGCWFDASHPDTGMAVGWYLQSTDRFPFGFFTYNGGATITAGSLFQVYFYASSDVWFTNSYSGVVVGNGIIQTTDGGNTWNLIVDAATTQAGILENVMFTNSTDGYAVGQRYDFSYTSFEGMIYKTSNAGGSWTDYTVSQEVNNENTQLRTVYSTGNGVVYAGAENTSGGSTLFKSTNDGVTWTPMTFSQSIWSLFFTSADTGFAATTNGLYTTTDAGVSWSNILPTTSALHTIQIKNGVGFTAGENGNIYMTSNNGITWTSVISPVSATISDLAVISPNLAYAVGASGTFLKFTNNVGISEKANAKQIYSWIDENSNLNIQLDASYQHPVTMELISSTGAVVKRVALNHIETGHQHITTEVKSLSQGIYILKISDQNSCAVNKITIAHPGR